MSTLLLVAVNAIETRAEAQTILEVPSDRTSISEYVARYKHSPQEAPSEIAQVSGAPQAAFSNLDVTFDCDIELRDHFEELFWCATPLGTGYARFNLTQQTLTIHVEHEAENPESITLDDAFGTTLETYECTTGEFEHTWTFDEIDEISAESPTNEIHHFELRTEVHPEGQAIGLILCPHDDDIVNCIAPLSCVIGADTCFHTGIAVFDYNPWLMELSVQVLHEIHGNVYGRILAQDGSTTVEFGPDDGGYLAHSFSEGEIRDLWQPGAFSSVEVASEYEALQGEVTCIGHPGGVDTCNFTCTDIAAGNSSGFSATGSYFAEPDAGYFALHLDTDVASPTNITIRKANGDAILTFLYPDIPFDHVFTLCQWNQFIVEPGRFVTVENGTYTNGAVLGAFTCDDTPPILWGAQCADEAECEGAPEGEEPTDGAVLVSIDFDDLATEEITALGCVVQLPPVWQYDTVSCECDPGPAQHPEHGATRQLEFAWISPAFPTQLRFYLLPPTGNPLGSSTLTFHAVYYTNAGRIITATHTARLMRTNDGADCGNINPYVVDIVDGPSEDSGEGEASTEGEGGGEGETFGSPAARSTSCPFHTADQDADYFIQLDELLRVIQFYNSFGYHCADDVTDTEDGLKPGPGANQSCAYHDSDYNTQNWVISLAELLRVIQFYNSPGYHYCPLDAAEDEFCPGTSGELGFWGAGGADEETADVLVFRLDNLPESEGNTEITITPEGEGEGSPHTGIHHLQIKRKDCVPERTLHRMAYVLDNDNVIDPENPKTASFTGTVPETPAMPEGEGDYVARNYYGVPLEPYDGIWVGTGQHDSCDVRDFFNAMTDTAEKKKYPPSMLMFYLDTPMLDDELTPDLTCFHASNIINQLHRFDDDRNDLEGNCEGILEFEGEGDHGDGGYLIPQIALSLHSRLNGLGEGEECGIDETFTVDISDSDSNLEGHFKLLFGGQATADIAYNEGESGIQEELQGLLTGLCPVNNGIDGDWLVSAVTNELSHKSWSILYRNTFRKYPIPTFYGLQIEPQPDMGAGVLSTADSSTAGKGLEFVNGGLPVDIPLGMPESVVHTAYEGSPEEATLAITNRESVLTEVARVLASITASHTTGRPFFLRIGYEANSQVNNYCPYYFREAFARIVTKLRTDGLRFASVWHVEAGQLAWAWWDFYPGDEYVDWVGTSIFYASHLDAEQYNNVSQNALAAFADAHNKPLIIAESSPIQAGVVLCEGESIGPDEGEIEGCLAATSLVESEWFTPYFEHVYTHPGLKALSYINNDWSVADPSFSLKNCRLGSDETASGIFRGKISQPIFKKRPEVPGILEELQPYIIRSQGKELMRFLPNGDLVISSGDIIALQKPDWTASKGSPFSVAPEFAFVDAKGNILAAVESTYRNLYLRGLFLDEQTLTHDATALFEYKDGTDNVLAQLGKNGDLSIKGHKRVSDTSDPLLDRHKFGPYPFDTPGASIYQGYKLDPFGEQCTNTEGEECECFRSSKWFQKSVKCKYPIFADKSTDRHPVESISLDLAPYLQAMEDGNIYLLNGQLYQQGATAPTGTEDDVELVRCDDVVKAKIVVQTVGEETFGHLWIAGRVLVGYTPPDPEDPCWYSIQNNDEYIVVIDNNGNLMLQGLLYVDGAPVDHVDGWPLSPGN